VGSGSTDVGSKGPAHKPDRPTAEDLARPDVFPELRYRWQGSTELDTVCGAMSQQHGHGSNEFAPQKFVHLWGARYFNARAAPRIHPRSVPPKP